MTPCGPNDTFGSYLRSVREFERVSLRGMAKEMGISHVYLGEVERGIRGPLSVSRTAAAVDSLVGLDASVLQFLRLRYHERRHQVAQARREGKGCGDNGGPIV